MKDGRKREANQAALFMFQQGIWRDGKRNSLNWFCMTHSKNIFKDLAVIFVLYWTLHWHI